MSPLSVSRVTIAVMRLLQKNTDDHFLPGSLTMGTTPSKCWYTGSRRRPLFRTIQGKKRCNVAAFHVIFREFVLEIQKQRPPSTVVLVLHIFRALQKPGLKLKSGLLLARKAPPLRRISSDNVRNTEQARQQSLDHLSRLQPLRFFRPQV